MLSICRPFPSSYRKGTHGELLDPTLGTPSGDKFYNQYYLQCEVCPIDHGKVVESIRGEVSYGLTINWASLGENLSSGVGE